MNSKEILRALQKKEITPEEAEKKLRELLEANSEEMSSSPTVPESLQEDPLLQESWEEKIERIMQEPINEDVLDYREIHPGVVLLSMHDRKNKNTFSAELLIGLMKAFAAIQENKNYKVVILTGYDNYFSSGGNSEGLRAVYEGKVQLTDIEVFRLPLDCEIPVIAAMQGHAIGSGWCMGLLSDYVIKSSEGYYACNHMHYGFTPGDGATLVIPERLGPYLGHEILYSGRRFRGSELKDKGAFCTIVNKAEVLPYAIRLGKELSEKPREALMLLKEHLTAPLKEKLATTLQKEWEMQQKTFLGRPEVFENILSAFKGTRPGHAKTAAKSHQVSALVQLNSVTEGRPVFWFHGESGGLERYQVIAEASSRPFYGLQARGQMQAQSHAGNLQAMAAHYVSILQSIQAKGPYDLGGFSLGGVIAYEVTRQLQEKGEIVASITMIDTYDNQAASNIPYSRRSKILQAVNMTLLNRIRQEPHEMLKHFIHQNEVSKIEDEDELLQEVIRLGKNRGLSQTKSEKELYSIFQQYLKLQEFFTIEKMAVKPLPQPDEVACYYFHNSSVTLYGPYAPYLTMRPEEDLCNIEDYWSGWSEQFAGFYMLELDASSHFMMLFESAVCRVLVDFCKKLYSKKGLSSQDRASLKTTGSHDITGTQEQSAQSRKKKQKGKILLKKKMLRKKSGKGKGIDQVDQLEANLQK